MTNGEKTATICVLNLHLLRFPLPTDYPNLSLPIKKKSGISFAVTVERPSKERVCIRKSIPETLPPYRRTNLANISYTSQVVVYFIPNFVAMATAVGQE